MDHERQAQLFQEARRIQHEEGPVSRDSFLVRECDSDEERQDLQDLLDAANEGSNVPGAFASAPLVRLKLGDRLGKYVILAFLDDGGQGEVYRAHDPDLDRDVAIKIIREDFSGEDLDRFKHEAVVLASLKHPNIVVIHEQRKLKGRWCLVMEFLEGETLAKRVTRGPIAMREALPWAEQIADALESAHGRDIVHRDLKPANIMIADGRVKVLDFGLARARRREVDISGMTESARSQSGLPEDGRIEGTLPYMAPEQLAGEPAYRESDVWSFGCVVYEMATGRPAFAGTRGEIEQKIRNVDPDWSRLPSDTPYDVRPLLKRCLVRERKRRLKDIREARLQIEDARIQNDPAIHPEAMAAAQRESRELHQRMKRMNRREWLAWTAATAGAAYVGWTLWPAPKKSVLSFATGATVDPVSIALSPDGSKIAFAAATNEGTQSQLYWLDAQTPNSNASPLPDTEGAMFPFWSPNNRSLGFGVDGQIRRIDDVENPRAAATIVLAAGFMGGAWIDNSNEILFGTVNGAIKRVAVDGRGSPVQARGDPMEGQTSHRFPQLLPGGKQFLYYASGRPDRTGVWLATFNPKTKPQRLLDGTETDTAAVYARSGHLLYVRDGKLMARPFNPEQATLVGEEARRVVNLPIAVDRVARWAAISASSKGPIIYRGSSLGQWKFTKYDRDNHTVGEFGDTETACPLNPSLSRNGKLLAYSRFSGSGSEIVMRDGASEGQKPEFRRRLCQPQCDSHADLAPIWSPNNDRLAFASDQRQSSLDVYVMDADAPDLYYRLRSLEDSAETKTRGTVIPADWSPDGQHLLYERLDSNGTRNLWSVEMTAPEREKPGIPLTQFESWNGQFSPDGQWVACQSSEFNSGRSEIYVTRFLPDGRAANPTLISNGGGVQPRWNPDGKMELFYVAPNGTLMAARIDALANGKLTVSREPLKLKLRTGGTPPSAPGPRYMVLPKGEFLVTVLATEADAPDSRIKFLRDWMTQSEESPSAPV